MFGGVAGGCAGNTMQSELTAFGSYAFNQSHISLSVYGGDNNKVVGQPPPVNAIGETNQFKKTDQS